MSSKFQIVASLENDALHLQMRGEFDGSAACDLIRKLEEGRSTASQVLVDTTNLQRIHPFGKNVFDHRIGRLSRTTPGLLFIGKNRHYFQS
ncbi:MAG: hypothetical protein MUC57_09585 [Desulfobacterales bacterium]|jgi:hypothetical protein|nr:hypothetical protein [Desulfobacterales bacterium]